MGALGYTMQRPEEEKYLNKKDEMLADLVSFFGGRAAEEVKFNTITTGASNDIERRQRSRERWLHSTVCQKSLAWSDWNLSRTDILTDVPL